MRKFSQDEIKSLKALTSYPEWQIFLALMEEFKLDMKDINNIAVNNVDNMGGEVYGKRIALYELDNFFNEINAVSQDKKAQDKTYE